MTSIRSRRALAQQRQPARDAPAAAGRHHDRVGLLARPAGCGSAIANHRKPNAQSDQQQATRTRRITACASARASTVSRAVSIASDHARQRDRREQRPVDRRRARRPRPCPSRAAANCRPSSTIAASPSASPASAAERRVEPDRALEDARDLRVGAAEQVDDLDRLAVRAERAARREPHRRGAGRREQHDQPSREPLQRARPRRTPARASAPARRAAPPGTEAVSEARSSSSRARRRPGRRAARRSAPGTGIASSSATPCWPSHGSSSASSSASGTRRTSATSSRLLEQRDARLRPGARARRARPRRSARSARRRSRPRALLGEVAQRQRPRRPRSRSARS